ncbi:fibronectin type III domain-containing protein [Curtobacterium sp. SL109]|uniref:fibronectin type III domain-containing protein n=1 Tax=Curtobacterium sp. SL109 TaxID=2994662 RepID=UPI0022730A60|nr:fibronectin type III domain-containing protein [Curtobacterium sp. SL109]MCY1695328.1 fibronectin type III domain-containing protein [Curtobacterium sp. SL109]
MYKAVLTVAAATALIIGGAAPAHAAPPAAPGVPTAVQVSGSATTADVSWGAPSGRVKVTGYTVTITPAERQPHHGVDQLPASARTDDFGALTTGKTYTFAVRAVAGRASSAPVTVKYTPSRPVQQEQSLFALTATGEVLQYPTTGVGPATTVTTTGVGFTANKRGDVFVPSADLTSIVAYPGDGSPARTVATGLQLTADLRSDDAGNIYWKTPGGPISTIPAAQTLGTAPGTGTSPTPAGFSGPATTDPMWAVGGDGTVATVGGTLGRFTVGTRKGSVVTSRTLVGTSTSYVGNPTAILVGPGGDLYINQRPSGGAGAWQWLLLKSGATEQTRIEPRTAFQYAAVNSSAFFLLQSKEWCTLQGEYSGSGACDVDRSIPDVLKLTAGGAATTTPVTGVTAGGRGPWIGVADTAGDVFFNVDTGPTPGLWRVPAGGGAAQQVNSGQISRLVVI